MSWSYQHLAEFSASLDNKHWIQFKLVARGLNYDRPYSGQQSNPLFTLDYTPPPEPTDEHAECYYSLSIAYAISLVDHLSGSKARMQSSESVGSLYGAVCSF